jgi:hypothetical protein
MTDLCFVVKPRRYATYYSSQKLLEPIFHPFLGGDDAGYAIYDISHQANVPLATLYSWRERVGVDPTWHPSNWHFAENPRMFPEDVGDTMETRWPISSVSIFSSPVAL